MVKNSVLIAVRSFVRHKYFTLLNISGLAIGLTACFFIANYALHEHSFDRFHERASQIYRINQTFIWGETDNLFGSTGPAVAGAITAEIPEFETIIRIHTPGPRLVTQTLSNGEKRSFDETKILAADSNFFEVFTFPMISGNPKSALLKPYSLVLTESTANKYFNTNEVIGETLVMGEGSAARNYRVTGVIRDIPSNSHIEFDFLQSMSSYPRVTTNADSWIWTTFVTFGVLNEQADAELAAQKLALVPEKYLDPFLRKYRGVSYEEFISSGEEWGLYMQPLLDIHLRSQNVYPRLNEIGDIETVNTYITVGILILLISVFNFINLATAQSSTRAKEVGLKKVLGTRRGGLIYQFLIESILMTFISGLVAVILMELLMPYFLDLSGFEFESQIVHEPYLLIIAGIVVIFIGILAGIYPAFYLSGFQPVNALKGKLFNGLNRQLLRNFLVTLQFSISILLIVSALVIYRQVDHVRRVDLGFDRENKFIIRHVERLGNDLQPFMQSVKNLSGIQAISVSEFTPPRLYQNDNFGFNGFEGQVPINYVISDEYFTDVYGIELLYGRTFDTTRNELNKVIITEATARAFDMVDVESALNKKLDYYGDKLEIIGIAKDFSPVFSLDFQPMAIIYETSDVYKNSWRDLSVQYDQRSDDGSILASIQGLWNSFNAEMTMQHSYLEKDYENEFKPVMNFGSLITIFAGLAIFISCLGLIGLLAFVIERRSKEIGIRKALGASIANIILLITRDLGKWLLLAFIIASPLAWYVMSRWLEDFLYRTNIPWYIFPISLILLAFIFVITVSLQVIKASTINPVDYLKEE